MGVRRFFLGSTDTVSPGAADAGLFSVGAADGAADAAGGAAATAAIGVGAIRCFFSAGAMGAAAGAGVAGAAGAAGVAGAAGLAARLIGRQQPPRAPGERAALRSRGDRDLNGELPRCGELQLKRCGEVAARCGEVAAGAALPSASVPAQKRRSKSSRFSTWLG